MYIYLMRHGDYSYQEGDYSLTQFGKEESKKILESIKSKYNIDVSKIYHSGVTRAYQTALIARELIDNTKEVTQLNNIYPEDNPQYLYDYIMNFNTNTFIVGHQPNFECFFYSYFDQETQKMIGSIKKSSVICLKKQNGNLKVQWIETPSF